MMESFDVIPPNEYMEFETWVYRFFLWFWESEIPMAVLDAMAHSKRHFAGLGGCGFDLNL